MNTQFTWLHIGLGSFHRAHQAWYLHRLRVSGDSRWHIAAGNIRNDAEHVVQALAEQRGRYVLETVSPEGEREYEEIASIQKLLPWQAGLQPLIDEGANPQTKVIAFTVTEGVITSIRSIAWKPATPICRPTCRGIAKPFMAPSPGFLKNASPTTRVR